MKNTYRNTQLQNGDVVAIGAKDVAELLNNDEPGVLEAVKTAYQLHARKQSSLPHSNFLLFPDRPRDRIIALPAYLGGGVNSAGLKWIASFPENIEYGLNRASATMILNSMSNGQPKAILEGSLISAARTAASAALAAGIMQTKPSGIAGLLGCGVINFEIARYLRHTCPAITTVLLFDLDREKAEAFRERYQRTFPDQELRVVSSANALLEQAGLVSFATTAARPHIADLKRCPPGAVVLHISLRDLAAEAILSADNVVDDVDHVCRAETSLHLAERVAGNRQFIRCTLGEILNGTMDKRASGEGVAVFSPFGLGILDVAVGEFVFQRAVSLGRGTKIPSFLPDPWDRSVAQGVGSGR